MEREIFAFSKNKIVEKAEQKLTKIISQGVENLTVGAQYNYPENFGFEYQDAIRNGAFPIIIANHLSLFGALPLSEVASDLTRSANVMLPENEKTKGFLLPFATTVANGSKGMEIKKIYDEIAKPILDRNSVKQVYLTRAKDVQGGESPNLRQFKKDMTQGIEEGYRGISIFVEGTVKSGRRRHPFAKRNGMQPLQEGVISVMSSIAGGRNGKELVFIPVGIHGDEKVFDPAFPKPFPHPDALILGLSGKATTKIVQVNIGNIIRSTDSQVSNLFGNLRDNESKQQLDNYFGSRISELLPQDLRGVYK